MKKLISILLSLILFSSFTYAQWYQAYSQPIAQSCYALKFYNTNTGYHSGVLYNGSTFNIYKTTNGGVNWTAQNSGFTPQRFMAIHILHPDTVFICGNYGKILRTYNGGQNWLTVHSDTNVQLWAMKFVNSNTGFTAGSFGTILKTTNKGDNWFPLQSGLNNALQGMHFINVNTGFVCGSLVMLKTTNAGTNWTNLNAPYISAEISTDVFFNDEMTGWFSTNSGRIVKTTNGGMNWNIVYEQAAVWRLSFTNSMTGYGCRSDGKVVKTTNGGDNWHIQNTPLTENLYDIHFPAEDTGFIASWSGKILKTTNGGGTIVSVSQNGLENNLSYDLFSNFPNPFNPSTKIKFSLKQNSFVKLSVCNTSGNIVAELIKSELKSGEHEIVWNAGEFPAGVYFCKLSAGNQNNTLRLVLIK